MCQLVLPLFDYEPQQPPRGTRPLRNDVRNGDAAEALVLSKLLRWGFDAHATLRDLPYDLAVHWGGRILRVQVKVRSHSIRGRWSYRFVKGNPRTGSGARPYLPNDYDVSAVVAGSLEKVLFFPGVFATIRVTNADFRRHDEEAQSWRRAIQAFDLKFSV